MSIPKTITTLEGLAEMPWGVVYSDSNFEYWFKDAFGELRGRDIWQDDCLPLKCIAEVAP